MVVELFPVMLMEEFSGSAYRRTNNSACMDACMHGYIYIYSTVFLFLTLFLSFNNVLVFKDNYYLFLYSVCVLINCF